MKQIDSMLPCLCSVIDHRRHQNVVRTSVTHLAFATCATFLFLPHFDDICDVLLNMNQMHGNMESVKFNFGWLKNIAGYTEDFVTKGLIITRCHRM